MPVDGTVVEPICELTALLVAVIGVDIGVETERLSLLTDELEAGLATELKMVILL